MLCTVTLSELPECELNTINKSNLHVQWDKLSSNKIAYHESCTYDGLCNVVLLDGVKCINANFQNHSHTADIDTFYDEVTNVLSKSGERNDKASTWEKVCFHTCLERSCKECILVISSKIHNIFVKHDLAFRNPC